VERIITTDRTYPVEELTKIIPDASFSELKIIMEVLRQDKILYTRLDFNYINRLVSQRLIELGKK
jgi:hypothetical protein